MSAPQIAGREFDSIVESLYQTGSGLRPWTDTLAAVASLFNCTAARLEVAGNGAGVISAAYQSDSETRLARTSVFHSATFDAGDLGRLNLVLHGPVNGRGAMNAVECQAFARLGEICVRVIRMADSLSARSHPQALAHCLMDGLQQPIVLLDSSARLMYCNEAARRFIDSAEVILLRDQRLRYRDPELQSEFSRAITKLGAVVACDPSGRPAFLRCPRRGKKPLLTVLQRLPTHSAGFLFTCLDPDAQASIDPGWMCALFDLTPAEAAVASLIASGRSPGDCSTEMGVKVSTIRTQLLSIYGKTGTSGQGDLVRSVLVAANHASLTMPRHFPARPLHVIVPFPPGGTTDTIVRALAREMARGLSQRVIVENRPGGDTVLGITAATRSDPDGYTLVSVGNSLTVNQALMRTLPYDPMKDLRPVSLLARTPLVLAVRPGLKCGDLTDLIRLVKSRPDTLSYASLGNATAQHVTAESWKAAANLRLRHMPATSQATAISEVIESRADLLFANLIDVLPHLRSGKLKALAVATGERLDPIPEVPTLAEYGFAGFESYSWFGLEAPAGVPENIVAQLNSEVTKGLRAMKLRDSLVARGLTPLPGTPTDFGRFLQREIAKYRQLPELEPLRDLGWR